MSSDPEERLRMLHDSYAAKVNFAISQDGEEDIDELLKEYTKEAAQISVVNAAPGSEAAADEDR